MAVPQLVDRGQDLFAGLFQLQSAGRVDDIRRGEAPVNVARIGPDKFRNAGREGDQVVVRDAFDLFDAGDGKVRFLSR